MYIVCTPRPSKCVNKWDDIDDESHFDLGLSCSRSFRKYMVLSAGFSFQLGWTPCCPGWACTSSWAKDPKDPVMMSLDSSPP